MMPLPAVAAIVNIDVNDSNHVIQASDTDQVVGGNGSAWNFYLEGGPTSVAGLSYVFTANAFAENTSGSGSADSRFIFSTSPIVVPLPGALWLLGPALLGLAAVRRH